MTIKPREAGTMWTVIYRHPEHFPEGEWRHDRPLYETREQAIRAGHSELDGTGVDWQLMSIPGGEDDA